jgi:glycerophosphoryl diester phosphodiesterase
MNHSGEFTHLPPRIFKLEGRLLISALISILISLGGLSAYATSISLVVSEVLYDPTGTEPDEEWIEIYNLGSLAIDLTHYKVGDEETSGGGEGMLQFPSGALIAPGQVIVIANKATGFFGIYGFNPDYEMVSSDASIPDLTKYLAWASGSVSLANAGDDVLILDASDSLVDALSWGNSTFAFNPPASGVPAGHSLERQFADMDTDTASDWVNQATPHPGQVALKPIPEPGTHILLIMGVVGLIAYARRRRK